MYRDVEYTRCRLVITRRTTRSQIRVLSGGHARKQNRRHVFDGPTQENGRARRCGHEILQCMVEEFLLVQCGCVGFFMTPAVYKVWGGHAQCWDNDGRVATMDIQVGSCFLRISSVYLPPVGGENKIVRQQVLEAVLRVQTDTGDGYCVVFGGDWNSHIGRDGVEGRYAMLTPSSFGGK